MSLLEVLVALTLLGASGIATLQFTRQVLTGVAHARVSEARFLEASRFMDAVALWPRATLDQRLGRRAQGDWTLFVEHPPGDVYLVSLWDTGASRMLVATALYRPTGQGEE